MSENWKSSYHRDKRLEGNRRDGKLEAMNLSLKQNCFASATRTSVETSGNMSADKHDHMKGDEEDDDYMTYLDRHNSDVDSAYYEMDEGCTLFLDVSDNDSPSPSDNNVSGSNVDVNTGYNKINDDGDDDYITYLDRHNSDIDSACDEMDEGCTLFLDEYVSDNDSPSDNNVCDSDVDVNSGYNKINDDGDDDYITYLDTHKSGIDCAFDEMDEDCILFLDKSDNVSPSDNDVSCSNTDVNTGYNNINDDRDADYITYLETHNSDINSACDEMDEDCTFFLDKYVTDNESDLLYSSGKNTTKTFKEEDGSNSSDSGLIILENNPICENTPFVSSKTYDLSFFEKEGSPRDGRQLYADDHSPFRRRLMENLERPYDHHEYIELLTEVYQQKQTERHLETRRGVVKSYHTKAVSKSYLELYPDLLKAIIELKAEEPKVLFLLRGFFFWLQNLPHDDGVFRPWADESCLETLRKM